MLRQYHESNELSEPGDVVEGDNVFMPQQVGNPKVNSQQTTQKHKLQPFFMEFVNVLEKKSDCFAELLEFWQNCNLSQNSLACNKLRKVRKVPKGAMLQDNHCQIAGSFWGPCNPPNLQTCASGSQSDLLPAFEAPNGWFMRKSLTVNLDSCPQRHNFHKHLPSFTTSIMQVLY